MIQEKQASKYETYVRQVEDFPSPGVLFYDISPMLGNGTIFAEVIKAMAEPLRDKVDKVACLDARGFIFGGAVAVELGVGCVMLRKPGKLPGETYDVGYDLEYGSNQLEIQKDSILPGENVAIVDDVLATGGTALAAIELVRTTGANVVEFCAVIDLCGLHGSEKVFVAGVNPRSIIEFE